MKIIEVNQLEIPDIKTIRFGRFNDVRGYFTEHYRKSDFENHPEMQFMRNTQFFQSNESFSRKGTIRGLHFQWNPYMGKLVRTLYGHMVDIVLDIRIGSPTFGKILMYDMPANFEDDYSEWIWIPPGFAHGNFFVEDTLIEYFCSGEYSPNYEAGISPMSKDIDFSLCENELKNIFDSMITGIHYITDKDKNGYSLNEWKQDSRSANFIYSELN